MNSGDDSGVRISHQNRHTVCRAYSDRDIGLGTAISTSMRAVIVNPGPMAIWGLIVTGGLVLGSIPLFLGLIFVMPVLGHATWHLYRKVMPR